MGNDGMLPAPNSEPMAPDSELIARAREGDSAALRMLIDRHKDAMVNYLTRMTGSRGRAEELAQESFVRLYTRPPRVDDSVAPWLFRVATNLLRNDERRARRARRLAWFLGRGGRGMVDEERRFLAEEAQLQTQEALAALPIAFRAPLVLREIQGLSYEEIALALDCPLGTVRSRINRGRAMLRERLAPYWKDGA
jgi:RNA polymerase sigma-70 factor, ECF subfamily